MQILIDGYNLMHVFGIRDEGQPSALSRARRELLDRLVAALSPEQALRTTVVFDAKNPPPGAEREIEYHGLQILFAIDHEEADDLIEELIQRHSTPKKLTVVSTDRRIQAAATRRRATAIDSEPWFDSLSSSATPAPSAADPSVEEPLPETDSWVEVFSEPAPPPAAPPEEPESAYDNPFPPGYADDVVEEWEEEQKRRRRR